MQHHGAILHNVEGCVALIAEDFGWGDEVFLSFLPASHAYEHSGGQIFPIGLGAPNLLFGRAGEARLQHRGGAADDHGRRAAAVRGAPPAHPQPGREAGQAHQLSDGPRALDRRQGLCGRRCRVWDRPMDFLLGRTLRPKIAARFGGRIKAMVSGGAPLNPEVGIFFHSLGLTLLQGYGQTEAAPVISCNRPSVGLKMDTVGPPLKNTEVRIAEDGEILVPRRAGHAGLLAQRGPDRADADRRLAAHRRRRPYRRARAGSSSPTARRTSSSTTRATMSRRRRSRAC